MILEHFINLNYFIRSLPENHLFKMIFGEINNVLSINTPLKKILFLQLQPSAGSSSSPSSPATATPPSNNEVPQASAGKPSPSEVQPASETRPQPPATSPSLSQIQPPPSPVDDPNKDTAATPPAAISTPVSDRHSPAAPQPARTPGSEEVRSETTERTEGVAE